MQDVYHQQYHQLFRPALYKNEDVFIVLTQDVSRKTQRDLDQGQHCIRLRL